MREAVQRVGVSLLGAPLDAPIREPEYRRAFVALVQEQPDALIVHDSAENFTYGGLIIELAEKARLPVLYPERMFVEAGGLLSYGADYLDLYRHAAQQIGHVLNGAKPGEIPFYQTARFKLIINSKAARALGLTLPASLFARADEVIE